MVMISMVRMSVMIVRMAVVSVMTVVVMVLLAVVVMVMRQTLILSTFVSQIIPYLIFKIC